MSESFTLTQMLDVLEDLIKKKQSGSLFITSEDSHFVTFGLEGGRIISVMYGPKRGVAALPLIAAVKSGAYRFDAGGVTGKPQELPTTKQIVEMLRSGAPAEVPASRGAAQGGGISEAERNFVCSQLKDLLAKHLGPIAGIVIDDALEEAGDICEDPERTHALVDKLVAEIDSESEAAAFRARAERVIAKLAPR